MDKEKLIEELDSGILMAEATETKLVHIYVEQAEEILALLKEQEAVAPNVKVLNGLDRLYRCSRCHKCFFYEHQKFCDQCGQAVKWE